VSNNPQFIDPISGPGVGAFSLHAGAMPMPSVPGFTFEHDPGDFSDLPPALASLFEPIDQENGYFSCTPQRLTESGEWERSTEFKGYRPTLDEIGVKFGPGKWRYHITYRPKAWKNGDKTLSKCTEPFILSEEAYSLRHQEYRTAQQESHIDRLTLRREQRQAKYGVEAQKEDPLAMLTALASVARSLQPAPTGGVGEMLPMVMKMSQDSSDRNTQMMTQMMSSMAQSQAQMMTMMMTMMQASGQASQQMMTAMMQISNESTNRVVGLLGNTNKDSSLAMFKEFRTFVSEGIAATRMVQQVNAPELPVIEDREPEEKSNGLVETILSAVPMVLQHLAMLNSMPAMARKPIINSQLKQAGPDGQAAYRAMKTDRDFRVRAIVGFVTKFGEDQVEEALRAMLIPFSAEELEIGIKMARKLRGEAVDEEDGEEDPDFDPDLDNEPEDTLVPDLVG